MIEGKPANPWEQLSDYDKDRIERLIEWAGIEVQPWQKQLLACFALDPPGTTYVLQPGRKGGVSTMRMLREKLETFE